MLTRQGCLGRQQRLREAVQADWIVITAPWHIHYLANFYVTPNGLNLASTSFLVLTRDGGTRLFVDNWNAEAAASAVVDDVVVYTWYDMRGPGRNRHRGVMLDLIEALSRDRPRDVAVEPTHLPFGVAQRLLDLGCAVTDVTPALRRMRLQKDPDELDEIRRVIRVAEAGHAAAREAVRPGVTELDVYTAVASAAVKAAGEVVTILGDFASGGRSGGPPTERTLEPGDLMIVDFFPVLNGYRADITNTYAVSEPTDAQRRYMDLLLKAKAAGEALLRPGVTGCEVYAAVRSVFEKAGVAHLFPHHAGHALGLMHPESPFFVPESQEPLRERQVVTLEPGLYGPEVGGMRIEDNYLITATGFERLSNHSKGL